MNNKLTVNRLAFGNLRVRKKQYTLMIIGIVLAMIFSSGVMFFLFCMDASIQELNDKKMGKQDITVNCAQNYQELINVDSVGDKGFAYIIGYGYTDDKEEDMGAVIAKLDEKAEEISYIIPKEGRMPEKRGEIALESDALSRLGLYNAKIGDKITLKVKAADGESYLPEAFEKTYTLVGKLWDKRNNIEYVYGDTSFYPAAVVSNEEEIELGGKENVICFMTLKNPSKNLRPFYDDARALGLYDNDWSTVSDRNILTTTSERWNLSGEQDIRLTMLLMVILSAVLMIASCCGIVNAFNTNLQERRRQIGMLRAVGATKRQIVKIFGREAFIIALLTTPLSLVISYFAVRAIIGAMGDDFVFIAEWWVLAVCGAFSVVCVMAAAFIPLFLAARVSPMQAIRNIELSRKMRNKRIRSEKSFNAPKLIAKRNLMFYRKKRAAVSLILIITIFVSCFGFSLAKETLNDTMPVSGDYHIQNQSGRSHGLLNIKRYTDGYTENDRNEIFSHHYVSEVNGRKSVRTNILTEEYSEYMHVLDCMSSERFIYEEDCKVKPFESIYDKTETERYKNMRSKLGFSEHLYSTSLNGYEASEILEYMEGSVYKGEVNIDKLNSGEEVIIIAPERIGLSVSKRTSGNGYIWQVVDMDRFEKGDYRSNRDITEESITASAICNYKVGDTVKLSTLVCTEEPEDDISIPEGTQRIDREVKIAAIVTLPVSKGYFYENLSLYTTVQGFNKLVPDRHYWSFDINLNEECTAEIDEEMTAFVSSFNAGNDASTYFHSYFQSNEDRKSTAAGIYIAIFSISVLFFSICASVVNNSLTAQIREGKREIGTLRAVGASAKELTISYFRQLLSMFGWGCGLGFGIYTLFWFAMFLYSKYIDSFIYTYEIWQAALICLALLVICTLNLYSKIKKQMKNSIVENIREL